VLGSALPAVHGSVLSTSDGEYDDYWTSSAAVGSNLGTYDAEGQRVIQVFHTAAYLQCIHEHHIVMNASLGVECYLHVY